MIKDQVVGRINALYIFPHSNIGNLCMHILHGKKGNGVEDRIKVANWNYFK